MSYSPLDVLGHVIDEIEFIESKMLNLDKASLACNQPQADSTADRLRIRCAHHLAHKS